MWFAGRRIAGRTGGWIAVLILASSPFAITFGSETRMYSLVMLLVTVGYLAVRRLLEKPSLGRQAVLALITALLLYTQYWAFYLIAVVGAALVWQAWRGADADRRHAARSALVAIVAGAITFLPWIPTFLYQSEHTGTPWGDPIFMTASFAFALRDFAGGEHSEAYAFLVVLITLTIVAVFGRPSTGTASSSTCGPAPACALKRASGWRPCSSAERPRSSPAGPSPAGTRPFSIRCSSLSSCTASPCSPTSGSVPRS